MRKGLLFIALSVFPLLSLQAGGYDPELLQKMGLAQTGGGLWKYTRIQLGTQKAFTWSLDESSSAQITALLNDLPKTGLPDARLIRVLAPVLEKEGIPADEKNYKWFERDAQGNLRVSDIGKNAVAGVILGDPWGGGMFYDPKPLEEEIKAWPSFSSVSSSLDTVKSIDPVPMQLKFDGTDFEEKEAVDDGWKPLGPLPVGVTTSARRYSLAGEGAHVLDEGESQVEFHLGASNYIYRKENGDDAVRSKYESHFLTLGFRHGFTLLDRPAEAGVQWRMYHEGSGFMDNLIEWVEKCAANTFNSDSPMNEDRFGPDPLERGYYVERNGEVLTDRRPSGYGFSDVAGFLKLGTLDWGSGRLASRIAVNIAAGDKDLSRGNFGGVGVSIEQKLASWLAAHVDLRSTFPFESHDTLGLPLERAAMAATFGLEAKLWENNSVVLQGDISQSPYQHTGIDYFDHFYSGITLGFNQKIGSSLLQLFMRENFDGHNGDADFMVGASWTYFLPK